MPPSNLQYCKYYHGEDSCPAPFLNTVREIFWQEERMFVHSGVDIAEWRLCGEECRARLQGDKKKAADRYTPDQFAVIMYIETHYSSFDPYNDMSWIYDY